VEGLKERPACRCHGEPMARAGFQRGGTPKFQCRVALRERHRRFYAKHGRGRARPRCACHGEACHKNGRPNGVQRYRCAVRDNARKRRA